MKKLFLIGLISFFKTPLSSQNLQWARSVGGVSVDVGNSITTDNSGNVYTIGAFQDVVDFDPGQGVFNLTSAGGSDVFILKQDSLGNLIWAKQIEAIGYSDAGRSIKVDNSGNVFITGYVNLSADFDPGPGTYTLQGSAALDIFVSKLDAAGNFVWANRIGGTGNDQGEAIALDPLGNVYVAGVYNSNSVDFDPGAGTYTLNSNGGFDFFVSKFNPSGNFIWAKRMGSATNELITGMSVDASGNVYTTGTFSNTIDFDPGVGTYTLNPVGSNDCFVSKLDSSGNFVWAIAQGGTGADGSRGLTLDANANVYTTGNYAGTADFDPGAGTYTLTGGGFFISKLNAQGNFVWVKSINSTGQANSIALDNSGNIYSTGYYSVLTDFDPSSGTYTLGISSGLNSGNAYILKLDPNGDFVWAEAMHTRVGGIVPGSICTDNHSAVYSTGYYTGICDFDPDLNQSDSLAPVGSLDMYLIKLGPQLITGISENRSKNQLTLLVYPNPNAGEFTLRANTDMQFTLVNNLGQLVSETSVRREEDTLMNVTNLPAGIYFLIGQGESGSVTKKVIITK